jgi:hypothetical protein
MACICLAGLSKATETLRIAGGIIEIRTQHLPNTCTERYLYPVLLNVMLILVPLSEMVQQREFDYCIHCMLSGTSQQLNSLE